MTNTLSVHNPEIWSRFLLKNFNKKSVMAGLVNRQHEEEIAAGGDVVRRQKIGTISVGNYTPGSDVSVQGVTSTELTMDLDQKKTFAFFIDQTELKLATNKVDLIMEYTKEAAYSMALTVDTFLLAKSSDVDSGNIIGSSSAPKILTPDNILEYVFQARKLLNEDNISPDGRVMVIDADTEELLLNSGKIVQATATGDAVVRNGKVGQLGGFEIVVSNNIATTAGVKDLMFFHKDFIDLAMRIPADYIEPLKLPLQFGEGRKGLMLYGGKVFNPTAGVVLKKAA